MERGGPGRLRDQWRGESSPNPRAQPPTPSEGAGGRASGRGEGQDQQRPGTSGAQQSPTRKVLPPASVASRHAGNPSPGTWSQRRLGQPESRLPAASSLARTPAAPHIDSLEPPEASWPHPPGCRNAIATSGRVAGQEDVIPQPWRVPVGHAILYGSL